MLIFVMVGYQTKHCEQPWTIDSICAIPLHGIFLSPQEYENQNIEQFAQVEGSSIQVD